MRITSSRNMSSSEPLLSAQEARALLERYYDGLTTPSEEHRLRLFLASAEADEEEFAADRGVFSLQAAQRKQLQRSQRVIRRRPFTLVLQTGLSVAACLALVAGIWSYGQRQDNYVAYIGGERYTQRDLVMDHMALTLHATTAPDDQPSVRSQMEEIFNLN